MGEMTNEGEKLADARFDLTQFYQVFFEEAAENLSNMEQLLLRLDTGAPQDEDLNAIFRCAHSIKGGAATFGFQDVADLTHVMETLLDRLRRHEIALVPAMVDTLLQAGDALGLLLARRQGAAGDAPDTSALVETIRSLSAGPSVAAPVAAQATAAPVAVAAAPAGERTLELYLGPLADLSLADDVVQLFGEVGGLGRIEAAPAMPGQPESHRRFKLVTTSSDNDLIDLCAFHLPRDHIALAEWVDGTPVPEPGWGLFADLPESAPAAAALPAAAPAAPKHQDKPQSAALDTTIRVSVDKVDQLINLMGELVITQAMLSQRAGALDGGLHQQFTSGLADLERTTRDLQESVMSIRMIPMAGVFNRFPRMLRDLAARLGKQVELRTVGEATELDKSLIEKITDPLTHLVRNSLDHGIEMPADRVAAGKAAQGVITLSAQHSGGSILIQVRDDGRGLDREKILAKARNSNVPLPDNMSDQDVWQLIFAPGFSTAEVVTDVSGRGVGMDVVKRNILSMGGSVELDSAPGMGTCVSVRLPLTLAIMDGMSISVGGELYLLPLGCVVESFQADGSGIKTLAAGSRVVKVREEYLPVVPLDEVFCITRTDEPSRVMLVVVEAEGRQVALQVDQLVGQQQVVVKNLEANYRKVPNVSGATIMGDGSVALILDVSALVRRGRQ
jgi:two-component system chemotaxis sensor kinase CheA